jgi:hypothetical protein
MKTPASRRRDFVRAKNSAPDASILSPGATAYELMLAKLDSDKRRLKQIQSVERKIAVKRETLPDYDAWVSGVLAGDKGGQDDVVATVMVWKIDTGDYVGALKIAEYVFRHTLALPDNYKRTAGCLVAEEIADAFLKGSEPSLDILLRTRDIAANEDKPDEVAAKLEKAIGLAQEAVGDLEGALSSLQRALELHAKVGVKKDIERVARALKNRSAEDEVPAS